MAEKLKILAIEDDKRCAELLRAKLDGEFVIEFAHSKRDGIKKLDESRWDVIFLDLGMHDAKRETILDEIEPHSGKAAIIILTGHNDPRLRDFMMFKQVDGFAVKGVEDSKQDLRFIIEQAIKHRQKRST